MYVNWHSRTPTGKGIRSLFNLFHLSIIILGFVYAHLARLCRDSFFLLYLQIFSTFLCVPKCSLFFYVCLFVCLCSLFFFARQSQNDLWLLRFSRKILLSTAWAAPLLWLLLLRRRQRHVKSFKVVKKTQKNTEKNRKKQQIENFIINEFRGGIEGPLRVIMRGQCGVYATRMKISAVEPR